MSAIDWLTANVLLKTFVLSHLSYAYQVWINTFRSQTGRAWNYSFCVRHAESRETWHQKIV